METFEYKAEIQELKSLVEKRFGHRLCTTNDFERLSVLLLTEMRTSISTSTLKRIWQYVNDEHAPRMSTLDILARYVGHTDFVAFCRWRKEGAGQSSAFFSAERIVAADLSIGDEVEIGWAPNRLVRLCHKGEGIFEVVSVHESKLMVGDRLPVVSFILGEPLSVPYIIRNGENTLPFVAGKNGGLTILSLVGK